MATVEQEPGMNDAMAQDDRAGYKITVDDVTGKGTVLSANDGGGMSVGNAYDGDPMQEEYGAVTYVNSETDWGGSASMAPDASMPRRTTTGTTVASRPQTRTAYNDKGE